MTVIHADCRELDFDTITSCHVLITDPPFSPRVQDSMMSSHTLASGGPAERDVGFDALTPELRQFVASVASLMTRWSVVCSDKQGAHLWDEDMIANAVEPIRWVTWIRWSQPQISGDRPCSGAEEVLIYHATEGFGPRGGTLKPVKKHWNGAGGLIEISQVEPDFPVSYHHRSLRGDDKHPTEKPLDEWLTIVSAFSDPGERVLDLFAGFGTTALACRLLGRECIAVEKRADWAAKAAAREAATSLSKRDSDRVCEWLARTEIEAMGVKDLPGAHASWERAQRRIADAKRVQDAIGRMGITL